MAYIAEQIPNCLTYGAVAEASFETIVAENLSGYEQRTQRWVNWRMSFDLSMSPLPEADFRDLKAHFATMRGRLHSWPLRDFTDYQVTVAQSRVVQLSPGVFQLHKRYGDAPDYYDRPLTRIDISEAFVARRGGAPMTAGAGAGQYALSANGGTLTVQPDQTRSISSHVVGATHRINITDFSPNVSPGNTVYLSGVSGTAAGILNGVALTVATVGSGFITLNVNTTSLTASGGNAARRIAASEITFSGAFFVPVRYDVDRLNGQAVNRSQSKGLFVQPTGLRAIEVREL